jgi:uncharacterized membrane protein
MNYLKSVKATFVNWFNENQTLALVLGGAILLPLGVGLIIGVVVLYAFLLSLMVGTTVAVFTTILSVIGAIIGGWIGYVISR